MVAQMDELDLRNPEVNTQESVSQHNPEGANLIDNFRVTSVNHMTNLKTLRVAGYCGVDQEGLANLTGLTELDISYNPKVTDLTAFTQLTKLKAAGTCTIRSVPPSVTDLDLSYNKTLTIDNLPNLKRLIARGDCNVTPTNVPSLEYLDVSDNPNF